MVPLSSLWLPILLSAVFVFVASSIIHMVLGYHRHDFKTLPKEDAVMDALRSFSIPAGDYMMPRPGSPAAMKDPAFVAKRQKGPVAIFTIMPGGDFSMGAQLAQWFIYCVVVSLFAAYIASRALPPGAEYLRVSQFASATAFAAYALGQWPQTIWYKKSMAATIRNTLDSLLYAFLTGGTLGWLWPKI